ncbi:MAG: histidine--tRNA ligase family protein [Dehalococcoidia bacterium]|nr:MAG: histidine--tRNA ligase family protein [Dehalococcoidia bacterium]
MKVQKCKGTRDLSPEEMARFRLIEGVFRDCCLKWGYGEVRTPTLEYLHLFTATGTLTPNMLGKVYSFLDWDGWSGERVVLRPDGTIPVARLYIENMGDGKIAKLFYVANVFIFEATGKETREKWQCGVELVGVNSPLADVELIKVVLEVLGRLGLGDAELRLSHIGLIRSLLHQLGLSSEQQTRIFDRILDGDREALTKIKPAQPELKEAFSQLLDLKGKSPEFLKDLAALFSQSLPQLKPHLDNFITIVDLLEELGCNYHIDLTSGKGFEYYTGVLFHLFWDGEEIGGGGRYDALIPLMGGGSIPASGFALYLDRLMNLVKPQSAAGSHRILLGSEPSKIGAVKESFRLARQLREAGYVVALNLGGEKLADFRWLVDVRKGPIFILTDQLKGKKFGLKTAGEVLRILGEEGGSKTSPA